MTKSHEATSVVWAHGFGALPQTDLIGQRVRRALERENISSTRPALASTGDGRVIPFPLDEQAAAIQEAAAAEIRAGRRVVIGAHSQGGLPAARAIQELSESAGLALFAVPLGGLAQRLGSAMQAGGVVRREGFPDTLMTPGYWDGITTVDPMDLVAAGLRAAGSWGYVVSAGADTHLGPQTGEFATLRTEAPEATITTIPDADHFFKRPHAEAVAQYMLDLAQRFD